LSQKYCFLAVEGPHDQAAITKLLQLSGLQRFDGTAKFLDPFWEGFVPKYPKGGNLYTRMDMPTILISQTHSVAIYWGEGSKLVQNLIDVVNNQKRYAQEIQAFGLIVDADVRQPDVVAKEKATALRAIFPTLSEVPGAIAPGSPRTGIYVLPDNKRLGVLDSTLVDCASIVYPDHKNGADQFLNGLNNKHTIHLNSFAREKAIVACIVSILRPGAANTPSILQDKWISEQTSNNNDIILLHRFIKDLLELPSK